MYNRPTIKDIVNALSPLANIPCPETDNDGDPINGDTVFPYLSPEHAEQVRLAESLAHEYARRIDGEPDRRSINAMTRRGFRTTLGPAQYEPDRLTGSVTVGDWHIDISDVSRGTDEY